jgi:hypothetical protein
MSFTRTRLFLAAGAMTLAGAAGMTTLAAAPASAATSPVVAPNCAGQGQVRPKTFDNFGCMPSQESLVGLSWQSWTTVAIGHGHLKVNNCTPTCAQGTFVKYPVHTELWRARAWPDHPGQKYFSRLTWIFTGKRPSGVPAIQTLHVSPQS